MRIQQGLEGVFNKIYGAARYARFRARNRQFLFIIGHMRAGTSLLVHILNTNSEVLGYGETHITYNGHRSLMKLHDTVYNAFKDQGKTPDNYRYVMDKILHDHIQDPQILRISPLKIVVIVRPPTDALPSILDNDALPHDKEGQNDALTYYCNTLQRMTRWLSVYDRPYVVVDYAQLTAEPQAPLHRISEYLSLERPLTPEYETIWATGKRGIGDSSPAIEKGAVSSVDHSYDVEIDPSIIAQAQDQYDDFLSLHCSH